MKDNAGKAGAGQGDGGTRPKAKRMVWEYAIFAIAIIAVLALFFMVSETLLWQSHGTIKEEIKAPASNASDTLVVKLFKKENCTPCSDERDFLDSLAANYSRMRVAEYDVDTTEGLDAFKNASKELGFPGTNVPVTVVNSDFYVGFTGTKTAGKNILVMIDQAYKKLPPAEETSERGVTLFLFWNQGCPHCAAEKAEFFPYIRNKYPDIDIRMYELGEEGAIDLLDSLSAQLGFEPQSVPITVVGKEYYIGYANFDTTGKLLEGMVDRAYARLNETGREGNATNGTKPVEDLSDIIEVPFFGKINMKKMMDDMGIPMSTMALGLLDGFNPCAFFVLTMLLSFLVYAKSRKMMLLIGLTFVFISGLVYFLFMTSLFTAIKMLNEIRIVAFVGGVIAIVIGAINLKDFFAFKKGFSLMIPEDKKPALYKRMRGLLKAETMVQVLIGTAVLAFVVNSYELLCTAGIPIVYGNLLNAQQLDMLTSYSYIALYNVFYVMPLLVIVLFFAKSLGGKKMSQETGELLKAISGFMMFGFGVFLMTDPRALSNILLIAGLILLSVIVSLVLTRLKKKGASAARSGGEEPNIPDEKAEKPGLKTQNRRPRTKKNATAKKPKV